MTRLFERVIGEGQDSSEELPENDMIPRKSYRKNDKIPRKVKENDKLPRKSYRRVTRFLERVIGEQQDSS